jgi:hypothetical protein
VVIIRLRAMIEGRGVTIILICIITGMALINGYDVVQSTSGIILFMMF